MIFSSSSIIESNLEYVMCTPERGISFENVNSLEYLDLHECCVSADFLSHIPDTLKTLSLCRVVLLSSSDGVKLPVGLKKLEYRGDSHQCTLPLISNFRDLTELDYVAIKVSSSQKPERTSFEGEQTELYHVPIQSFITNLPTQIKSLFLHAECSPKRSSEGTMICRTVEVLHSFPMLQDLDFKSDCASCSFDLSLLPPLMKLKLAVSGSLIGHFPSTLRFLDFRGPIQSFEFFWKHYVMPLQHLVSFSRDNSPFPDVIDFRGLPFPKHLSYFNTYSKSVVLDSIPDSTTHFYVG
ncbi:unnamed protein product [Ambrosiozyma monospora]|uniref:Unnamed protein product n=1 Tax=Ambrosiozyma monospora TaxID=43982 RepID=A0ACB5SXR1_AMBMO|nr:unnamed protein product [Ambrosiozyma monospora]